MPRSHGWAGDYPRSDGEAITRILDAADEVIARRGSSTRLSDVARALGVTRQTIYRYFPSVEALIISSTMRVANGFLDRLTRRLQGVTNPVDAMVEGMAFAIENLEFDEQVALVLNQQRNADGAATAQLGALFSESIMDRLDIDWEGSGYDPNSVRDLTEFSLRVTYSFLANPSPNDRRGADLRAYLHRWVGPAIAYPTNSSAQPRR